MTGKSRRFSLKITAIATVAVAALTVLPAAQAQGRKGAPIKYVGQSSQPSAMPVYSQPVGAGGAPIRFASTNTSSAYVHATPTYSQPVTTTGETARTKRIEFRYPDKSEIQQGSYSPVRSGTVSQETRQYASVGAPTPIVPQHPKSPVLHQPNYPQTAIEEVAMSDFVRPSEQVAPQIQDVKSFVEPIAQPGFEARGVASWYGDEFHGQPTANGELFDMTALTAAHPTLPLPSLVQVVNLDNNREIVVRVNDRGPFVPDRMIDVSKQAADELGFLVTGEANVAIRYLGPAPVAAQLTAGQGGTNEIQPPAREFVPDAAPYVQPRMDPIPNPEGPAFFIQAGSFSQMENAQRLSEDLGGSFPVDVVMANVRGADFFRVMIGPYGSRADADAMRDQLAAGAIVNGVVVMAD